MHMIIDYFGVAMATASIEDNAVIKDVTAENNDDNVVIGMWCVCVCVCLSVFISICAFMFSAGGGSEQLVKVIVSHIEDPGEFYIQYSSDHHNLTSLMTQLAEHCNENFTAIKFNSGK